MTEHAGEDEEDRDPTFSELIGETRPIKSGKALATPLPRSPPSSARIKKSTHEQERFRRPDPDEPRLAAAAGVSDSQLLALRRGEHAPEERIDLHGLRAQSVPRLLAERIESAASRGIRCVLVIHGRGLNHPTGEALLRERLPEWLMQPSIGAKILAFAPAPPRFGGDGAVLVLLRRLDPASHT